MSKGTFIAALRASATQLAQFASDTADQRTVYDDRGYEVGGDDEIIDSEVPDGLTAADITAMIAVIDAAQTFINNTAHVALNKLRTDL